MRKIKVRSLNVLGFSLLVSASFQLGCHNMTGVGNNDKSNVVENSGGSPGSVSNLASNAIGSSGSVSGDANKGMADGTSHGGGGNSINTKMLESYLIDPLALPTSKAHLSKLASRLSYPVDDVWQTYGWGQEGGLLDSAGGWSTASGSVSGGWGSGGGIDWGSGGASTTDGGWGSGDTSTTDGGWGTDVGSATYGGLSGGYQTTTETQPADGKSTGSEKSAQPVPPASDANGGLPSWPVDPSITSTTNSDPGYYINSDGTSPYPNSGYYGGFGPSISGGINQFGGNGDDTYEVRSLLDGFRQMFKQKSWYLAPVKLKPVKMSDIGFHITTMDAEQVAIQTVDAVWIDETLFKKMKPEEQAKLILHEMVMQIYLERFYTYSQFCDAKSKIFKMEDFCKSAEITEGRYLDAYRPEQERALQAKDYEAIRQTTQQIFNERFFLTIQEFTKILSVNKFGGRSGSDINLSGEKTPKVQTNNYSQVEQSKTSYEEVFALIKKSTVQNSTGINCIDSKTKTVQKCDLLLTPGGAVGELPKLDVKFTVPGMKEALTFTMNLGSPLTKTFDVYSNPFFLRLFDSRQGGEYKIGDKFYTLVLAFEVAKGKLVRLKQAVVVERKLQKFELSDGQKFCVIGEYSDKPIVDFNVWSFDFDKVPSSDLPNSFSSRVLCQ